MGFPQSPQVSAIDRPAICTMITSFTPYYIEHTFVMSMTYFHHGHALVVPIMCPSRLENTTPNSAQCRRIARR